MFLNYIKQIIIDKKLKSLIKFDRHFEFPKRIHSIDIVIDARYFDQKKELVDKFIQVFGKKIDINLIEFDRISKLNRNKPDSFFNKDVSVKGKFTEKLKKFAEKKVDLFVSYVDLNNPYINWLSFHKRADFKIGFYQTNDKIFDFLINNPCEDYKTNLEELNKYLKIINNKK